MENLKNMAFIPKFHPAEQLKVRALKASCLCFCDELTPSQLDARKRFIQLYLYPSGLPATELLQRFMELLDKFFFFGLFTQVAEEDRLPLRLRKKPDDAVLGLSGYYNRSEYEITMLTTIWGTRIPSTLEVLLGTLSHEMTHAYLDVFYDTNLTKWEEVNDCHGHGTAFTTLCNAIHATMCSWSPALAGLHVDDEDAAGTLREDSLVIVDGKFRPIQEYLITRKTSFSLSRWALSRVSRIASKRPGAASGHATTTARPLVRLK